MALANPLWGAPRIHGELLKLGLDVSQRTVARLMPRRPKLPSQTWRTFLQNHLADLVSVDFFVLPTATFRVLYVFVVLLHHRRKVVHFNVTDPPLPPGRRNKLSKRSPVARRRATSSAIEAASTAASFGDG
jgi:putative transposase